MDASLQADRNEKREQRQDLVELAHPQNGVDALNGKFPQASPNPPSGVMEKESKE